MRHLLRSAIAVAASLLMVNAHADEKLDTYYGFGMKVSVDWTLDLESVEVIQLDASSPAAKAGVVNGDQIIDVEGCAVPGCGAYKAQKLMHKSVGEVLHVKIKHSNGTVYAAALPAIAVPVASKH